MNNPTPDWQLDRMYERESEILLEKQTEYDKAWDKMIDSVGHINVAIEHMKKAIDAMIEAKVEVENVEFCEDKVGSLIDTMEDLLCDVESLRRKFIKGEV